MVQLKNRYGHKGRVSLKYIPLVKIKAKCTFLSYLQHVRMRQTMMYSTRDHTQEQLCKLYIAFGIC